MELLDGIQNILSVTFFGKKKKMRELPFDSSNWGTLEQYDRSKVDGNQVDKNGNRTTPDTSCCNKSIGGEDCYKCAGDDK